MQRVVHPRREHARQARCVWESECSRYTCVHPGRTPSLIYLMRFAAFPALWTIPAFPGCAGIPSVFPGGTLLPRHLHFGKSQQPGRHAPACGPQMPPALRWLTRTCGLLAASAPRCRESVCLRDQGEYPGRVWQALYQGWQSGAGASLQQGQFL